jgi:hypothetical protein
VVSNRPAPGTSPASGTTGGNGTTAGNSTATTNSTASPPAGQRNATSSPPPVEGSRGNATGVVGTNSSAGSPPAGSMPTPPPQVGGGPAPPSGTAGLPPVAAGRRRRKLHQVSPPASTSGLANVSAAPAAISTKLTVISGDRAGFVVAWVLDLGAALGTPTAAALVAGATVSSISIGHPIGALAVTSDGTVRPRPLPDCTLFTPGHVLFQQPSQSCRAHPLCSCVTGGGRGWQRGHAEDVGHHL